MTTAVECAKTFFDAIERGDWAAVKRACAPQMTVWHNYDRTDHPFEWMIGMLPNLHRALQSLEYAERRFSIGERSVAQQHELRGRTHDGEMISIPVTMHVYVDDNGLIVRMQEYADSAQLTRLRQAVQRFLAGTPASP